MEVGIVRKVNDDGTWFFCSCLVGRFGGLEVWRFGGFGLGSRKD